MSETVVPEILEEKLLTDLSQLEALSSSMRLRILQWALDPVTVGVLAERFGVPRTRLYYHVNLLVDEGLLVEVGERTSGARVEHIYRTVARSVTPSPELLEDDPRQGAKLAVGLVLDPARTESETMIEKKLRGGSTIGEVDRLLLRFTDEQAREFVRRLDQFCAEFQSQSIESSDEGKKESYAFSFAFALMDLGTES
jgi:DNA-binding transcriptional ArsR family regulator